MKKRILIAFLIIVLMSPLMLLSACGKKESTITFDSGFEGGKKYTKTIEFGKELGVVLNYEGTPRGDNYLFVGWKVVQNDTEVFVNSNDTCGWEGNVTFRAEWYEATLYNAYKQSVSHTSYRLKTTKSGTVNNASVYTDGSAVNVFNASNVYNDAWFENDSFYVELPDDLMDDGGTPFLKVDNAELDAWQSFNTNSMQNHFSLLTNFYRLEDDLQEYYLSATATKKSDTVYSISNTDLTIENGVIVKASSPNEQTDFYYDSTAVIPNRTSTNYDTGYYFRFMTGEGFSGAISVTFPFRRSGALITLDDLDKMCSSGSTNLGFYNNKECTDRIAASFNVSENITIYVKNIA